MGGDDSALVAAMIKIILGIVCVAPETAFDRVGAASHDFTQTGSPR